MFPRDSFADRSVGFLLLTSTEAKCMKKRQMESERKEQSGRYGESCKINEAR